MKTQLRRPAIFRRAVGALAFVAVLGVPAIASSAGALSVTHEFYLVLGASESVGVQPTRAAPHGQLTPRGYANDLVALMAQDGVAMTMTQMGCPGASTTTMLFGGDRCGGTSQLARAVAFLHAHVHDRGVVSVDIGFNDLKACFGSGGFESQCVDQQLSVVQSQLPVILSALQEAAGPHVTFVGLNHDNPFLASAVTGHATSHFVDNSATAISRLNDTLRSVYTSRDIPVADVAGAFAVGDTTPVVVPVLGTVPTDLARVCALTWMCQSAPYGPNIHPNNAGYWTIARAIGGVLG